MVGPGRRGRDGVSVDAEDGRLALSALAAKHPQYAAQVPAGHWLLAKVMGAGQVVCTKAIPFVVVSGDAAEVSR